MALPSIVLLLTFVGGVFGSVCEWAMDADADLDAIVDISLREVALAAAIAAVAAWIHWRRFRVPITVAAGAAAVVGVLIALTGIANPDNGTLWTRLVMFLSGVGVFALAMRWDLSDLARRTRRSDVAFWLHLLAAPLIVNPVFSLASSDGPMGEVMSAIIVMVVYAIMGVIALTIDRRALLVSALAFLLAAINSLIQQVGALSLHTALTALIIGIALLALSAFWQRARVTIVSRLPTAWRARLPAVNA